MDKPTLLLLIAIWILVSLGILVYDYIRYHEYYYRKKVVILQMNNEYVRKILNAHGYRLDGSTLSNSSHFLYSPDGEHIYGYPGDYSKLTAMFKKDKYKAVNCNVSLGYFVYELHHQNLLH